MAEAGSVWISVVPSMSGFASTLNSRVGKAAIGAGAILGGALIGSAVKAMDAQQANAKIAAQLNLPAAQAQRLGRITGRLYGEGFGESRAQIAEAARRTVQDLNTSVNSANFQPLVGKVTTVAQVFDQDLGGVTQAVGNLMRNNLAPNASVALDLVSAGLGSAVNKSDDLLETLNEYSPNFQKLGLSGQQAMSLLNQSIRNGARNSDEAADALREFQIRASDGSKKSAQAFAQLNLNAEQMTAAFARGGPAARQALGTVLSRLRNTSDATKQNAIGAALFGTRWEDSSGRAVLAMRPMVNSIGQVDGRTAEAGKTLRETASGSLNQLRRGFENTAIQVGGHLLPAVNRLGTGLGTVLKPALSAVGNILGPLAPVLSTTGVALLGIVGAVKAASVAAGAYQSVMFVLTGATAAQRAATNLSTAALVRWRVVAALMTAQTKLAAAGTAIMTAAQYALGGAVRFALGPIGIVITVLGALAAGFTYAWKNSETFRTIVIGAWNAIKNVTSSVWNGFLKPMFDALGAAITFVADNWKLFALGFSVILGPIAAVTAAFFLFRDNFMDVFGAIGRFFTTIWNGIQTAAVAVWNAIAAYYTRVFAAYRAFFTTVWNGIKTVFTTVWNGIKTVATTVWNAISGFFTRVFTAYRNFFQSVWDRIGRIFSNVWNGIKNTATSVWNSISGFFGNVLNSFVGFWSGIWDRVVRGFRRSFSGILGVARSIWGGIKRIFNDGIDGIRRALNWPINKINGFFSLEIPTFKGPWRPFARGGAVHGPGTATSDSIPARLSDGEYVSRTAAVNREGVGAFDALNEGRARIVPKFNRGGLIRLGQELQGMGYRVGRHPFFEGHPITSGHGANSRHYTGQAIDVNYGPGGTSAIEMRALDRIVPLVRSRGFNVIWRAPNHYNHMHISTGGPEGGGGGVLGSIGGFFSGAFNKLTDFVGGAADPLQALLGKVQGAVAGLLPDQLKGGLFDWPGMIGSLIGKAWDGIKGFLSEKIGFGGGEGGVAPPGQINGWIGQALSILGFPPRYARGIYQQIMTESGGDPKIIQQITDINSRRGQRARGIMQVIPPTFNRWKLPDHGDIFNPVDNIIAGSRYAMNRYGPSWFSPGPQHSHGYDRGGILPPGVSTVYNGTGKPEAVFTDRQLRELTTNRGGGALIGSYTQQFYGDNQTGRALDDVLHTARVARRSGLVRRG